MILHVICDGEILLTCLEAAHSAPDPYPLCCQYAWSSEGHNIPVIHCRRYCQMLLAAMLSCLVHESLLCRGLQGVEWGESLPPVLLLHGTADTCALVSNATQFDKALEEAGAQVSRQETVRGGHSVRICMPPD